MTNATQTYKAAFTELKNEIKFHGDKVRAYTRVQGVVRTASLRGFITTDEAVELERRVNAYYARHTDLFADGVA